MAHPKEHHDAMIAFAVGGVALILILLYMFGGAHASQTNAAGEPLPTVTSVGNPNPTAYNYNIAPYNPDPGLHYGKSSIPNIGPGGCCDTCGPMNGNDLNSLSVAQFQTLI
jgi:hypothetical protein